MDVTMFVTTVLILVLIFFSVLLLIALTILMKIYRFVAGLLAPIFNLFKSPW